LSKDERKERGLRRGENLNKVKGGEIRSRERQEPTMKNEERKNIKLRARSLIFSFAPGAYSWHTEKWQDQEGRKRSLSRERVYLQGEHQDAKKGGGDQIKGSSWEGIPNLRTRYEGGRNGRRRNPLLIFGGTPLLFDKKGKPRCFQGEKSIRGKRKLSN